MKIVFDFEKYQEIMNVLSYNPHTPVMSWRVDIVKGILNNMLKGFSGNMSNYNEDLNILNNLRYDKAEIVFNNLENFKYYEKADKWIHKFMANEYSETASWDSVFFIESPFKMFYMRSNIESVEYFFTNDSVIKCKEDRTTETTLF